MAVPVSLDDRQVDRLRELRAAGASPKSIARTLGVRPAAVASWVRRVAAEQIAAQPEPPLVGCWVNPGWSEHLTVDGHDDWPDAPPNERSSSGLVGVLVARRDRPRRVWVCGYLVDVYCLGVKDVLGPRTMSEDDLPAFRNAFYAAFDDGDQPVEAPIDLARELVWGAIAYARRLGFSPTPEFEQVREHLGDRASERSAITFGRDGTPWFISGPRDNSQSVIRTLTRTAGEGNFHYLVGAPFG